MSFTDYIGIPWEAGAQGPNSYDCMAFFRFIQKEHFNIEVPIIIAPDYEDQHAIADMFSSNTERKKWLRIVIPEHGCAVLMHRPMHIGIWLDIDGGGVLHCTRGIGVIFTKDSCWAFSGYGRKEYFRHE
jgi:hypothetical protein